MPSLDDDYDNRYYVDPLEDPRTLEHVDHLTNTASFWDDPDALVDEDEWADFEEDEL